ncbi:MAG: UDP-3-O-(3-hydroxymyristoyl)glucosamine N-acyltransferase, partial [Methylocapsa sp.]|nr:UDP-3-O-(3-hydroxymyristoyl)glucosamine N-acyltransferase [Methylocapsa sp.]
AVREGADLAQIIRGAAPLAEAMPDEITLFEAPEASLETCRAAACFVAPHYASRLAQAAVALILDDPYLGFARALRCLFPAATGISPLFGTAGVNPGAAVHPEARLEQDVIVDPGAIIGPRAEIGSGSIVGANSVIGSCVRIGRNCRVSPHVTVSHALIGDQVSLAPGVRIGQPGVRLGPAATPTAMAPAPQIGRVIIQDGVEVGANSAIDRGTLGDTVLGEGTRIGDLVYIGSNAAIGRFCRIPAQTNVPPGACYADFSFCMAGRS